MFEIEFKKVLRARLLSKLPKDALLQIEMVDSAAVVNIQIADWIAGALARYLEKGHLGEECYKMSENGKSLEKARNFLAARLRILI